MLCCLLMHLDDGVNVKYAISLHAVAGHREGYVIFIVPFRGCAGEYLAGDLAVIAGSKVLAENILTLHVFDFGYLDHIGGRSTGRNALPGNDVAHICHNCKRFIRNTRSLSKITGGSGVLIVNLTRIDTEGNDHFRRRRHFRHA